MSRLLGSRRKFPFPPVFPDGDFGRIQGIEHEYTASIEWPGYEARYNSFVNKLKQIEILGRSPFIYDDSGNSFNLMLNGGRLYVDMGRVIEIATPECRDSFEMMLYEKASDMFLKMTLSAFKRKVLTNEGFRRAIDENAPSLFSDSDLEISCNKLNVSRAMNDESEVTRGTHESFLICGKGQSFRNGLLETQRTFAEFLAARLVLCGGGGFYRGRYAISPRIMFCKDFISGQHSDWPVLASKLESFTTLGERLHAASGEGLRCEIPSMMRSALSSYMVLALQEDMITSMPELKDPVSDLKEISLNMQGDWTFRIKDSRTRIGVIDYINSYAMDPIEELINKMGSPGDKFSLSEAKRALKKLDEGLFESVSHGEVEWATKQAAIKYFLDHPDSEGFEFEDGFNELPELEKKMAISNQFSELSDDDLFADIRKEHSTSRMIRKIRNRSKFFIREVSTPEQLEFAVLYPPPYSKAWARVELVRRLKSTGRSIYSVNWGGIGLPTPSASRECFIKLDKFVWNEAEIEKLVQEHGIRGQ